MSAFAPALSPLPAGRVDPRRSRVGFAIRKLGAGTFRGSFADFRGELGAARAHGSVRVAGIDTGDARRDAHLRELFAADEHPEITFVGRSLAGNRIRGELTIRGCTREIELTATPRGRALEVRGELDRRDFGLTWNRAIEASGAVGTAVRIELDLQLAGRRA
jgi:polyisoprenoid-binding protein YceI